MASSSTKLIDLQKRSHHLWKDILHNICYKRENVNTFKQIEELAKCKETHDNMCDTKQKKELYENVDEIAKLKNHHKQLYPQYCVEKQEIKDKIRQLEDDRVKIKSYYAYQKTLCYGVNTINTCYVYDEKIYQSLLCYAIFHHVDQIVDCLITNKANPNLKEDGLLLPIQLAIEENNEDVAMKLLCYSKLFPEFEQIDLMVPSVHGAAEKAGMLKLTKLITDENKQLILL